MSAPIPKHRHQELRRFTEELRRLLIEERRRCGLHSKPWAAVPMLDLHAADFVVRRLKGFLAGRYKTLDKAFSSGRKGKIAGGGKHLAEAIEAERLLEAGMSINKVAKSIGVERAEIKARRKRYDLAIQAAKIVRKLPARRR